jgi:hypothetical protein
VPGEDAVGEGVSVRVGRFINGRRSFFKISPLATAYFLSATHLALNPFESCRSTVSVLPSGESVNRFVFLVLALIFTDLLEGAAIDAFESNVSFRQACVTAIEED